MRTSFESQLRTYFESRVITFFSHLEGQMCSKKVFNSNFLSYMTLSWLKDSYNQPQKICSKLVTYSTNTKEAIYRVASDFL